MIEVRTYGEDAPALSAFMQRAWRRMYGGHMAFPLWGPAYVGWQLLADPARDYLVAAYEGSRLVGCILALPAKVRLGDRELEASFGGWATVDPEYQRHGVGNALSEEFRRRHLARGAPVCFGTVYIGATVSAGPRFWLPRPELAVMGTAGFWVRLLNHGAVARWEISRLAGAGALMMGALQRAPRPPRDPGIRNYGEDDLGACLALATAEGRFMDLAPRWEPRQLARQLSWAGVSRTIVAERGDRVVGFVNFYELPFLGREPLSTAVIDLAVCGDMSFRDRTHLLSQALCAMQAEGVALALILAPPPGSRAALIAAGFLPAGRHFFEVALLMDRDFAIGKPRRRLLPWR